MLFYDDDIDLRGLEDIKFDAEKFSAFMDSLAQDIDGYTEKARNLVSGYGKYYHNEAYGGRAADASKEFIANGQMDKLHVQNRNVQKDLFKACIDTKEAFEEMVDPSPKARISREALRQIKKDHQGRYEEMDMLGHEIEGMVREVMADFSDLTNFEYFDANPVREIYDEFSGNGGHVDKCIRKLEMFDEQAKAIMNQAGIIDKSELLQDNIRNTAGALDAMKVYNPSISKNSVGLVAFGANASYLDNGLASLWAATSNGTKMNVKFFASDKEAAEYLDSQMKVLCDDDNSNDEAAIANINAALQGFLYEEVVDGKKYVAYDQERIEGTLKYLEKDGLAHQLLSSVNAQINVNKKKGVAVPDAITKLGIGGKLENTKLEVRKDGAGVRLEVTSNNDLLPLNEIDHKYIAYAATKESSLNYFKNGDSYDWDAIREWFQAEDDCHDIYHCTSVEYDVLATEMLEMDDKEIQSLLNSADFSDKKCSGIDFASYKVSEKLGLLVNRQDINIYTIKRTSDIEYTDKYTRAVLIDNIYDYMTSVGHGDKHIVEISYEIDRRGQKVYSAQIKCYTGQNDIYSNISTTYNNERTIKVYPYSTTDDINKHITQEVSATLRKVTNVDVPADVAKYITEQAVCYTIDNCAGTPVSIAYYTKEMIKSEIIAINNANEAAGACDIMNYGDSANCMYVEGTVVHVSGVDDNCTFVYSPEFDDKKLLFSVEAYNREKHTNYTVDEMKIEFAKEFEQDDNGKKIGNSDIFDDYDDWFSGGGRDAANDLENQMLLDKNNEGYTREQINAMSIEEVEKYLKEN